MDLVSLFTNIADAIRGKKGTEDKIRAVDFASEIESIETGGGSSGLISKDVDFIDYDGTLLYSYTLEEIQAMTELPPLPTQEGLICQEWNWSLEDIKAHNRRLIVGATYITDDGKTRIYIDLTSEERLEMPLCFKQSVSNGVEVDWGDGSPVETFTSSGFTVAIFPSHEYSNIGQYTITLNPIGDCMLSFGNESSSYNIVGRTNNNGRLNHYYFGVVNKVEIGRNVTAIKKYTFQLCYSLSNVTIPNSVTDIESYVFSNCYSLTEIIIPNGVLYIRDYMFQNCRLLVKVAIPNSITSISSSAFSNCYLLSEIILSNNVTNIGNSAFSYNYSFLEIIIPNSVKTIGAYAFSQCYNLKKITMPNSMENIAVSAFNYCSALLEIIVPDGITRIDSSMFYACDSLLKIEIPNSVTSIIASAFGSCYSLTEIKIPSSVMSIESYAFYNCYSMKKYDFSEHTQVPTLTNADAFSNIASDCKIIVPDALYDEWIASTNWSNYASYIVKASEVA